MEASSRFSFRSSFSKIKLPCQANLPRCSYNIIDDVVGGYHIGCVILVSEKSSKKPDTSPDHHARGSIEIVDPSDNRFGLGSDHDRGSYDTGGKSGAVASHRILAHRLCERVSIRPLAYETFFTRHITSPFFPFALEIFYKINNI